MSPTMRKGLVCVWLLAPVALLGFHYGPGQRGVAGDEVAMAVNTARAAEATGDWTLAVEQWRDAAAQAADGDEATRLEMELQMQMARIMKGELPEALPEVEALLTRAQQADVPQSLKNEVRAKYAAMNYWVAWLMRLEGATTEEWMPIADTARQHFRHLAEAGTSHQEAQRKNLEATIRLQRMDLSELQALPLPKQCQSNKDSNCTGKCNAQRAGRSKGQGQGEQDQKVREQIADEKQKGAGRSTPSGAAGW